MRVAVMLSADGLLLPAQASAAVQAGMSVVALPACHISFYTDTYRTQPCTTADA